MSKTSTTFAMATVLVASTAVAGEAVMLEEIVVTGRKIENYLATDALTGTKSNALLKDLPLSISIVPSELIGDRAINQLSEALDSVAGAQRKQGYGGVQNFGAYLRGFDSSFLTLRNGVRDYGFYTLRDTANVERFEVLKGPGSVLYGAVYPGGITSTITKKPVSDPLAHFQFSAGSHDRYRGEMDLGGPVSENFFYRFNAAYEDAESFRDEVKNQSYFLAPVATWVINDKANLTVEVEHKHSEYTWDLGLPRNPVSFQVPISRFLGEPTGINNVNSTYANSRFEYALSDQWKFRQILGYAWTDGDYKLRSISSVAPNGRTINRVAYDNWEKSHTLVIQHEAVGEFATGGIEHQLVAGVEHYRTQASYSFFFSALAPIDIFEPVYGAEPQPGGFVLFSDQNDSKAIGGYAQDLISLADQWKLLVGARYDRVKNSGINLLTNGRVSRAPDTAFSPQAGLVFQPDDATSLYVSYGESFLSVTSGRTASGEDLKPEGGQQLEIGVKRFWLDNRFATTLAAFEIKRQNVSTPDPVTPTFRVQTAEQTSRGLELELAGSPVEGWDLSAAAAYIDAEVSEDNLFAVGSKLPGAARYSASLWNKYTIQSGALESLEMGVGVYYVGRRAVALPNPVFELPSYTRVDAMVAYPYGQWQVQANLKNAGDKKIYDLTSTSIMPQEPRSFTVRLAYSY